MTRFRLTGILLGVGALLHPASLLLAIQVPQSRAEFVRAVAAGGRGAKSERLTIDRPFDDVYRTLEARCAPCLDVEVRRSGFVGGQMEVSSSDYNPTLKRVGPDKAEFSLQVVHRPRAIGEVTGPGGLYIMAADLTRAGAARTDVVLYRPTIGFKDITRTFTEWVDGRSNDCPKMKY
jgi:hypothetical protein